jgi:MoxR-like ATPase
MTDQRIKNLLSKLDQIILGNSNATKLALTCLLAKGHLLIEDIPGVGKTTLSHALAKLLGLDYKRVQFTSDLLPSDILGVSIYNMERHKFTFKPGPIFTRVLLADEINRASPKTQSALLQAMEEKQVSVEGNIVKLKEPFFVIATQNPLEQSGTFNLPESQLDRFLMRISLGYPSNSYEKQLLQAGNSRRDIDGAAIDSEGLADLMKQADAVHVSEAIIDYLHAIMLATREDARIINGLSPRAGLQWLQGAKAYACIEGRDHVIPDDIQALATHVAAHRLSTHDGTDSMLVIDEIIERIDVS